MYYIIDKGIEYSEDMPNSVDREAYYIVDVITETSLRLYDEDVVKAVNEGLLDIKNADIVDNKVCLHSWVRKLSLDNIIVIAKVGIDSYKILDNRGKVSIIDSDDLNEYIKQNEVVNISNGDLIDTYDITVDSEFKKKIASEYKAYSNKSTTLGLSGSFDYTIEGRNVILTRYMGMSKEVVIPNFVTHIKQYAFAMLGIGARVDKVTSIKLSNRLEGIGNNAFSGNDLSKVEIPKSVKFISATAFNANRQMMLNGRLKTETLIVEDGGNPLIVD